MDLIILHYFSVPDPTSTGVNHTNESAGRHESSTIPATETSESRIKPEQCELTAINDILAIQKPESSNPFCVSAHQKKPKTDELLECLQPTTSLLCLKHKAGPH